MNNLKNAKTEALINFISIYRTLNVDRKLAKKIMLELNERIRNGEEINLNQIDDKSYLFKNINEGYVLKFNEFKHLKKVLDEENINYIKLSNNYLLIKDLNQEQKEKIITTLGFENIEENKKVLEDVTGTKLFKIWENS